MSSMIRRLVKKLLSIELPANVTLNFVEVHG